MNYKETHDRKVKDVWEEDPLELLETPESEDEMNDIAIEEEIREIQRTKKLVEEMSKMFKIIGTKDVLFPSCLKGCYQEDLFFKSILDNPSNFTNFEVRDELVFLKSEGLMLLAIPDVKIYGQSIREVIISQGYSLLMHLGGFKTLTYLRDQVWWKTIIKEVTDYCKSCSIYTTSKLPTEKLRGLLKMMPVPSHPW